MKAIDEAVNGYLAYRHMHGAAPKTLAKFKPILGLYASWVGDRLPGQVTKAELNMKWLVRWHEAFEARNGRHPEPRTVNSMIDTCTGLYDWLMKMDALVDVEGRPVPSPWIGFDRRSCKQRLRPWLEPDELEQLISAGATPERRFIARWLAHTGLRIEADVCRVMDVNLDTGTIMVAISKTDAGVRSIPINPILVPLLQTRFERMRQARLFKPTTPILYTRNGTAVTEQQAHRQLTEMGNLAGIMKPTGPQALRRTFGSILVNKGLAIEHVSKLMGHESISTTAKYYAEILPDTIRRAYMEIIAA